MFGGSGISSVEKRTILSTNLNLSCVFESRGDFIMTAESAVTVGEIPIG
jgi:hypothetical protein